MVFQNYALFPHMTVGENISFPLEVRKIDKNERETKVINALEMAAKKIGDVKINYRLFFCDSQMDHPHTSAHQHWPCYIPNKFTKPSLIRMGYIICNCHFE